jgi:uncharacterized protein YuzE
VNVFYDRKNDVVSIYVDSNDTCSKSRELDVNTVPKQRDIEDVEEAANLLLDMMDLLDNKGNLIGFRVFNASKHYDINLLDAADPEELSQDELNIRQDEKVIGVFKKD